MLISSGKVASFLVAVFVMMGALVNDAQGDVFRSRVNGNFECRPGDRFALGLVRH